MNFTNAPLPTLTTALRKIPAEFKPVVVIDSREQVPLPIRLLPSITTGLTSGDYSFSGGEDQFAVEKKSLGDLIACVTGERPRFERELHRLRGFRFARLLVLADPMEITEHRYRSSVNPQAVWGSLSAWECRFNIPVVFIPDPEVAGQQVERWIVYFSREILKSANDLTKATSRTNSISTTSTPTATDHQ